MNVVFILCSLLFLFTGCGCRYIRTAKDVTPGNCPHVKLDWRYGASDMTIQTSKITNELMSRWYSKTDWDLTSGKPRIIITHVDNRTDRYISTDSIRDIIEEVAVQDGRFSVLVGDARDERELDTLMAKIQNHPKYRNESRPALNGTPAPQFLAKIRLTKNVTSDRFYDYETYRMVLTLYDIQTQEIIDSAHDTLIKKVQACR
ncbi:MAG: hypothetical protein ACSNEK_01525 [Parachlamydiaceae bacterium]